MKKYIWFFLVIIFVMIVVGACSASSTATPESPQPVTPSKIPATLVSVTAVPSVTPIPSPTSMPTEMPSPTPSPSVSFEVVTQPNPQDENMTDVFIRSSETGEDVLFITLADVNTSHYNTGEFHNGNLYIIKRTGYDEGNPDAEWEDELWRYDSQGTGIHLFSTQGLDFRVAPDERFIAITSPASEPDVSQISILNAQGEIVQAFTNNDLGNIDFLDPLSISLEKWSDDSEFLWGTLGWGPYALVFFKILPTVDQVDIFNVSQLPLHHMVYDLNANVGKLVFSDYPAMFDVESVKQFEESQELVTLSRYDFETLTTDVIATSEAKAFKPRWLDDHTIEYDDPSGEGRIVYTLNPTE